MGIYFSFVCFVLFFCLSLLKMTEICFGFTILKIFWEKSGQGTPISLLALGARHPRYIRPCVGILFSHFYYMDITEYNLASSVHSTSKFRQNQPLSARQIIYFKHNALKNIISWPNSCHKIYRKIVLQMIKLEITNEIINLVESAFNFKVNCPCAQINFVSLSDVPSWYHLELRIDTFDIPREISHFENEIFTFPFFFSRILLLSPPPSSSGLNQQGSSNHRT